MKRAGVTKQTSRERAAKARGARLAKAPRAADVAPQAHEGSDETEEGTKDAAAPRSDVATPSDPVFAIAAALAAFGIAFWLYKTGAPAALFGVAIAAGVAILFVHAFWRSKGR